MDDRSHVLLAAKLLELCGCNNDAAIYSLLPTIDSKPEYFKGLYAHMLENQPKLLQAGLEIFGEKKTNVSKNSYEFVRLKEEEQTIRNMFNRFYALRNNKTSIKVPDDDFCAALALLSHIYLDTFTDPIRFFIPNSTFCSGQWNFWGEIDFLRFKEWSNDNNASLKFNDRILNSELWNVKVDLASFKPIIKKRLIQDNLLDKKLDTLSLVKAMIIRIGELGNPSINYEVIDYSIRYFFRSMNINDYIRIDREIDFLRKLEKEIIEIYRELL